MINEVIASYSTVHKKTPNTKEDSFPRDSLLLVTEFDIKTT